MKLNALRDFLAVAERGSLRAAARQLGVAQASITRSLQELEKELGITLFERRARGVSLSAAGEVFLRRARAVRSELQRAKDELDQLQGATHGELRVCLSTVPHMAMLPTALGAFRQRYPDVKLDVLDSLLPRVEQELKDGTIDCYIGPVHEGIEPELEVEKLFDNARVIMARKGHPLAGAKSLAELVDAEWATASVTHLPVEELGPIFERHNLPAPHLVVQAQSALTYLFTVAYSDLLIMLPIQWAQAPLFRHVFDRIDVAETLSGAPICIVTRTGHSLTPAAAWFCETMRQAARLRDAVPPAPGPLNT
jgi:LysR family transcriptional regulator of abg operon